MAVIDQPISLTGTPCQADWPDRLSRFPITDNDSKKRRNWRAPSWGSCGTVLANCFHARAWLFTIPARPAPTISGNLTDIEEHL
jgi:hypothetical protein